MHLPTFFISSTIYDFKDLRSSIKYYLEEQGCKVLASEYNDFEKPVDEHSYDACLSTIAKADYFILLVGSRVGGWYNQEEKISITQKEYQVAYGLHKQKKLKILNFVRSEVWQAKEETKELSRYLLSTELEATIQKSITYFQRKSLEDAEFIINFLNEIGRNQDTINAVKGKGIAPSGNWIHVFNGFDDIIDVISGQVLSSVPVEDQTNRRLLNGELQEILSQALMKLNDEVKSPRRLVERIHYECPITVDAISNPKITVDRKIWNIISILGFHAMAMKFHPIVIPQVLTRPTFLEFDLESNSFKETPVHAALATLHSEIRKFNESLTSKNYLPVIDYSPARIGKTGLTLDVESAKLAALYHFLDRWVNIVELSIAIIKFLNCNEYIAPTLRPNSPLQGMQDMIDLEKVTNDEVLDFISNYTDQ